MDELLKELALRDEKNAQLLDLLRQLNNVHTELKATCLTLEERLRTAENQPAQPDTSKLAAENHELKQKLIRAEQEKRLFSLQKQTAEDRLRNLQFELDARGREIELQKHLASVMKVTADRLGKAQGIDSLQDIALENETLRREKGQLLAAHARLSLEMKQQQTPQSAPPPADDAVRELTEQLESVKKNSAAQIEALNRQWQLRLETAAHERRLLQEELDQAKLKCRTQSLINTELQEQLRTGSEEMQQIISGLEQQIRELRAQNEELRGQIPPGPSKETS